MLLGNIQKKLPVSFGGAAISGEGAGYGFGDITELDSIDLLHYAYEKGFRIFDSAPIYGFGLSEKRIGLAFKDMREKVFITSKSGVTWHQNRRVNMTNDPKTTLKMVEQSLRDLKTDYIDLYFIHWPDKNTDIRKPMEILSKAKLEGKIKHIGLCNTHPDDYQKAGEIEKIEVLQSEFNFFSRDFVKDKIFPICNKDNLSFMSWGTLDKGILTGRVNEKRTGYDKSDCRSWAPWWKKQKKDRRFEVMKRLTPLFNKYEFTGLDLAVHFNLKHKEVSTILCGTRNKEQIDSLINSIEKKIPDIFLKEAEEIYKHVFQ